MYESFFDLNEKPFSLLPDPSFFYLSKIHKEALTLVEYGLHNQAGFTVLTGEIGSGKTTLMRYLLEEFDESLTIGLISHTHKSIGQIMDWVCVAFDLETPMGDRIKQHQALEKFLLDQYKQGKKALLIIDEAQNLGLDTLEEIRLLSNINVDKDVFLQLLLLGQPQLREQLRNPDLEQFVQRISASYHLGRLSAEEVFYYIRHRIEIAGGRKEIFTPDACHAIFHYSRGIPRIINLICETALVLSYGSGIKVITGKAIEEFVRNNASHLLLAIDTDEQQPLPEYIQMFVEESSKKLSHEKDPVIQREDSREPPAAESTDADRISSPSTSPQSVPTSDTLKAARSSSASGIDPEDGAPAPEQSNVAKIAAQPTSTDDEDATALAELIQPGGSTNRWTGEAIAISAGVLLGVALVGWYLYQQSGNEQTHATATDDIRYPSTISAPEPPPPSDRNPATETAQAAGADTMHPDSAVASQDRFTMGRDVPEDMADVASSQSTALSPSTDVATGAEESVAPENDQPPEPATVLPVASVAQADDDNQEDATTDALPETETALTGNLNDIERALGTLSLPVTRTGPNALEADFSETIRFEDGSVELDSNSRRILDQFADLLRDADTIRMKVVAHTDTKGTSRNNMRLSEQRAANVANYMRGLGIGEDRLAYEGKGEEELKVDAEREKTVGPWINRRIEIELIARDTSSR